MVNAFCIATTNTVKTEIYINMLMIVAPRRGGCFGFFMYRKELGGGLDFVLKNDPTDKKRVTKSRKCIMLFRKSYHVLHLFYTFSFFAND